MKKKMLTVMLIGFGCASWGAFDALARTQYRSVMDKMEAKTEAEKSVQKQLKAERCNLCHDKKNRKIVLGYGKSFHKALGQGDASKYKYDRTLWKRVDGKYKDEAIQLIRGAIKRAAAAEDAEQ